MLLAVVQLRTRRTTWECWYQKKTHHFSVCKWLLVTCWNSAILTLTTVWLLAAATQTRVKEPNIPAEEFTLNALPTASLPFYLGLGPAHCTLDCILWGLVKSNKGQGYVFKYLRCLTAYHSQLLLANCIYDFPTIRFNFYNYDSTVNEECHWQWLPRPHIHTAHQ